MKFEQTNRSISVNTITTLMVGCAIIATQIGNSNSASAQLLAPIQVSAQNAQAPVQRSAQQLTMPVPGFETAPGTTHSFGDTVEGYVEQPQSTPVLPTIENFSDQSNSVGSERAPQSGGLLARPEGSQGLQPPTMPYEPIPQFEMVSPPPLPIYPNQHQPNLGAWNQPAMTGGGMYPGEGGAYPANAYGQPIGAPNMGYPALVVEEKKPNKNVAEDQTPMERIISHQRAGFPLEKSKWARLTYLSDYEGYFVGGGVPKGRFVTRGEPRYHNEGVWGMDYSPWYSRVANRWSHGKLFQGGTGTYEPDHYNRPTGQTYGKHFSLRERKFEGEPESHHEAHPHVAEAGGHGSEGHGYGHESHGHQSNGHQSNGHQSNGHQSNGHESQGHQSHGHESHGQPTQSYPSHGNGAMPGFH